MDITRNADRTAGSHESSLSVSPEFSFQSHFSPSYQSKSQGIGPGIRRVNTATLAKQLKPFATGDIKILLLENINEIGQDILKRQGYQVEALKSSLPEVELVERIKYG